MIDDCLLKIENVSKIFPGVRALSNVSLTVHEGEVHALMGENGAGKSTLIKILSGVYSADEGKITFNGQEIKDLNPMDSINIGISTVHQELKLVGSLSVAENIFLGNPKEKSSLIGKIVNQQSLCEEAKKIVDSMGINIDVQESVENLSVAKKQIVEISKALTRQAKLIIMDEPSATLTENELEILFGVIKKLKENKIAVIYISHRLEEIFKIADRVTVLRDGKLIITEDVENLDRDSLIKHMVGRKIENVYPTKCRDTGDILLEVKNLNRKGVLSNISFTLRRGEILGIAGLVGSGRTELARAIFGADSTDSGEVCICNKRIDVKNVYSAIKHRIALVPEERRLQGIIPEMSVEKNITLIGIKNVIKKSFINSKLEKEAAEKYISMLRIATPSEKFLIKDLSGGNQQKCVLGKWLYVDSDILILDEPTRGIDVGAKQEIYKILKDIAKSGKGIIVISSELPEVLGVSHRVIVMHDGKITGEADADLTTQEEIMNYATL